MRYPKFPVQGLCTSSWFFEAGCKVAIGARLKRANLHWTLKGTNAIIAFRCCIQGWLYWSEDNLDGIANPSHADEYLEAGGHVDCAVIPTSS